jgi:hypothetical protein
MDRTGDAAGSHSNGPGFPYTEVTLACTSFWGAEGVCQCIEEISRMESCLPCLSLAFSRIQYPRVLRNAWSESPVAFACLCKAVSRACARGGISLNSRDLSSLGEALAEWVADMGGYSFGQADSDVQAVWVCARAGFKVTSRALALTPSEPGAEGWLATASALLDDEVEGSYSVSRAVGGVLCCLEARPQPRWPATLSLVDCDVGDVQLRFACACAARLVAPGGWADTKLGDVLAAWVSWEGGSPCRLGCSLAARRARWTAIECALAQGATFPPEDLSGLLQNRRDAEDTWPPGLSPGPMSRLFHSPSAI